jgi:chromosome segregation ATPase
MHLSSITIKGFKSFPERTQLVFSPGVSVIVGPNGCGKSNVTDAVLWALGEQSPLSVRGQTMQDMIYAGGEGTRPSRYAEVEVVLSNDRPVADRATADAGASAAEGDVGEAERAGAKQPAGFSEISIKRRHDRGGEGEYRINGARCRLSDVVETLADANLGREMHSVISQGRVEEIVHSKPNERRLLVEEAAGLGKHRKRRRRAQLKLERTQQNLDRALDVEREARSRLRPLKRQAQAADIHDRLERDAGELRATLLAAELRRQNEELESAERSATQACEKRDAVEARLTEANRRRTAIEERLAKRDRERTEAWGRLTAIRAAHERLSVRAESLAARRAELARSLESRRQVLGSLSEDLSAGHGTAEDPVDAGLKRIDESLSLAADSLERARELQDDAGRATQVGRVREASERVAGTARRVEELLAGRLQDSIEGSLEADAEMLAAVDELCEAAAAARDAVGERASVLEGRMLGRGGDDDVTEALRACSQEEAGLQASLRSAGEAVTQAEVGSAQLRQRRQETIAELERIARGLGRELGPADELLSDAEREEIERKLERLAARREQLGPVNPLAEREYAEALTHVEELETQRADLEAALSELTGLIRETDAKIESAFEQTFEATEHNFHELVEHLFPGGRGRLRLLGDQSRMHVLGGADPAGADAGAREAAGDVGEAERAGAEQPAGSDVGVEIEVTPAGKATRKLSLLSGGEKSLVALAFVFAVFLARPSPFYILDEVEAALDDANIDRFLQLVRRFSDRAQFIIVTHQKRTMDAADVLYGVSMGSGGITKVVSRRFEQEQPALDEAAEAA